MLTLFSVSEGEEDKTFAYLERGSTNGTMCWQLRARVVDYVMRRAQVLGDVGCDICKKDFCNGGFGGAPVVAMWFSMIFMYL